MKNRGFVSRFRNALRGLQSAWKSESSFKTQVIMAIGALIVLIAIRPPAIWWAVFALAAGGVLAAELINTAIEHAIDRMHPEIHPMIGLAKDCAAGAVLVMSFVAVVILLALIWAQI